MKWVWEVRGKAIMSAESVGSLSANAGEAKYKSRSVPRLIIGWMFVAWFYAYDRV
jgi:hypothetical protein